MKKTYKEAAHAMQTGVAAKMEYDREETEPKHLRVGVNSAMVETSALVQMLVRKGVFTLAEFEEELTIGMYEEAKRYQRELSERYGSKVRLL